MDISKKVLAHGKHQLLILMMVKDIVGMKKMKDGMQLNNNNIINRINKRNN